MAETRTRSDSSRDLLEELEDGWATAEKPSSKKIPADHPASGPDVNDLDEGWLDQLFPEEDEDDEEDEDEELPDERLDPVAFAAAKKALAERQAAAKERKKQKLEAKRTRQRAKAAAMQQKQKGKSKRKPAPVSQQAKRRAEKNEKKAARVARLAVVENPTSEEVEALEGGDDSPAPASLPPKKNSLAPKASVPPPAKPDTAQSIKLLAIVLVALLALAAAVAAIAK